MPVHYLLHHFLTALRSSTEVHRPPDSRPLLQEGMVHLTWPTETAKQSVQSEGGILKMLFGSAASLFMCSRF
jgi:hypothetical protein